MADKRIDAHTNTTTVADVDEFIVDSGSNGTRNITYSNLKAQLLGTTSIASVGNSVTEAIYNVHMDQAVPKIDTTTGVMYLEGGSAFEGNIDSTPTAGSNNAVSSGGTKTYVDAQISHLNDEIDTLWGRRKPTIAANTDMNTLRFTAVGEYTVNGNNKNIQNVPTEIKNVSFWLKTINILTNETTEINAAWKIRAQIIIPVGISAIYIRQISSGSSASSITYEPWKKITLSNA